MLTLRLPPTSSVQIATELSRRSDCALGSVFQSWPALRNVICFNCVLHLFVSLHWHIAFCVNSSLFYSDFKYDSLWLVTLQLNTQNLSQTYSMAALHAQRWRYLCIWEWERGNMHVTPFFQFCKTCRRIWVKQCEWKFLSFCPLQPNSKDTVLTANM